MTIEKKEYTIREIVRNYKDNGEGGVYAFDNRLIIRPAYQREFVYNEVQRAMVIDSVMEGFPLNLMYWARNNDGTFELMDGQQRTLSICQYINGDFAVKYNGDDCYWGSLPGEVQQRILDYELDVRVCEGTAEEKLAWFRRINIAGEKLSDQELRNAAYTGTWLADAKEKFSKTNCVAKNLSEGLIKKNTIRQELLELALDWISEGHISEYMSRHQHDEDASELWEYFKAVIEWVKATFVNWERYKKEMVNLPWGEWYNKHKDDDLSPIEIDKVVTALMGDEEVESKRGIFKYVLERNEKSLSLRQFRDSEKRTVYERQEGVCPICGKHYEYEQMEGDHIKPWSQGGKTTIENLQMLCRKCNHEKSNRY